MGFADKVLVNFTNCASSTQLFVEFAPYSCQIHHPNGNRSPSPPPSQAAPYTACIFAGIFFWSSLSYTLHLSSATLAYTSSPTSSQTSPSQLSAPGYLSISTDSAARSAHLCTSGSSTRLFGASLSASLSDKSILLSFSIRFRAFLGPMSFASRSHRARHRPTFPPYTLHSNLNLSTSSTEYIPHCPLYAAIAAFPASSIVPPLAVPLRFTGSRLVCFISFACRCSSSCIASFNAKHGFGFTTSPFSLCVMMMAYTRSCCAASMLFQSLLHFSYLPRVSYVTDGRSSLHRSCNVGFLFVSICIIIICFLCLCLLPVVAPH